MRRKQKIVGLGALLLLIGALVWLDISAHARKNRVLKMLTEKGGVVLSPSVTQALLWDLNSGDGSRMEQWYRYLQMCAGANTNLTAQSATLQDAFALYITKEKPGRSNFFYRLVLDLRLKQQTSSLSRHGLVAYLGIPDFTSDGPSGEMLQYGYQHYGKHCLASAVVSNDVVTSIDIYVK